MIYTKLNLLYHIKEKTKYKNITAFKVIIIIYYVYNIFI